MSIPEIMKGLVQLHPGGPVEVADIPVPSPGKGEVLVKMAAAPVNPSDLSQLNGTYAVKPDYPYVPGIEGSGLVVASGKGLLPFLRNGKRVACTSMPGKGGTWAEYMVTSAMRVIPIEKEISYTEGAVMLVNPLTAIAFLSMAKEGDHRSVVNTLPLHRLGRWLSGSSQEKELQPLI
ncbi:MAG: alcohol dehydrogenase catalytic domain-containing protein [Bacteroidales bacterium]